jgi:hypothetical protein
MSIARHIGFILAAALAFTSTDGAAAARTAEREVRINHERFVKLPLAEQARVLEIKNRLGVLMSTDRSSLDPGHRAALRTEWKGLKGEMKELNRGGSVIYISTAGLVLIIILLVILL